MGLLARLFGRPGGKDRSAPGKPTAADYRGAQVIVRPDSCRAAAAIAGRRYLADEVPRFPLDECDAADCGCTYRLFDDRRSDLRRASDVAYDMASELREAEDRRGNTHGRRQNDR